MLQLFFYLVFTPVSFSLFWSNYIFIEGVWSSIKMLNKKSLAKKPKNFIMQNFIKINLVYLLFLIIASRKVHYLVLNFLAFVWFIVIIYYLVYISINLFYSINRLKKNFSSDPFFFLLFILKWIRLVFLVLLINLYVLLFLDFLIGLSTAIFLSQEGVYCSYSPSLGFFMYLDGFISFQEWQSYLLNWPGGLKKSIEYYRLNQDMVDNSRALIALRYKNL